MHNTLKSIILRLFVTITFLYSSFVLSQTKFIEDLTIENFFSLLQLPENEDLLNFTRGFSVRLKSANPSRVSFPDRDEPDRAKDRYITQCDRRLDALARLLVGDEVCAAVAFDGDHTLYVATNNDGHFMSTFQCPLWTSIFTLWQHLAPISHMSSDISHPILYTEFTEDVRNNFVKEALPYLLIAPNSSLYADTATKKKKLDDQKINPLREFSRKLSSDFYRFETSASEDGFGEDLVERWIENLRPRLHTLSPPSFVVKSETDIADFYDTITQFFRDLLKIEKFFFTTDHKDPRAKTLVDAMGRGGGHEDALRFEMIDEGGKGVHAEMRLIAHFRMIEGKKIPYIGISRLCCAYCNVVMEHVLGVRCFELEDDVLVPTRGHHAVSFPWPIHEKLRSSEEFLQRFLGNNLYAQYRSMKGRSIDYPGISHQDRGEFALIILENLPRLSFNPASKAVAEKLGIFFPEGDRKHQIADPSIAFSETPTYFHTRKAFFLFDGRRYVDEGTDEFDRLQQLNSRSRRAALIDLPAKIGNEGLLYTGDHIHYILERHYLSENTAFTVIPPAATIFENAELLPNSTRNAVQAALAGNIVAMPIHLHGNHWVGAIFRRQADGAIQVIYNNPQGYVIDLEPNAVRFVATIQAITQNVTPDRAPNIIDLHLWQQCNGVDCGPFTVDNLVRLARYAYDHAVELDGLDRNGIIARAGLQHPADGDASTIRAEHHPIFTALGLQVPTETVEDDGLFNPDEDNDFSEEVTDPIDVVNTVDPFFLVSPTFEFGKQPISSANSIYGYGNNTSFYKSFLEEDSLLPVPIWSVNRHPSRLGFLFSDQVALPSYSRTSRPISIFFIQPRFSWDDYNIYSKFVLPKK